MPGPVFRQDDARALLERQLEVQVRIARLAQTLLSLPAEELDLIRSHIQEFAPEVRGFHRLRTRKSGSERFVDFHMLVDADMSVDRSHQISDRIMDAIKEHYPYTTLTVHIEPCHGDCLPECVDECLLDDDERHVAKKESR